jgi:hypothetical protein
MNVAFGLYASQAIDCEAAELLGLGEALVLPTNGQVDTQAWMLQKVGAHVVNLIAGHASYYVMAAPRHRLSP